MKSAQDFFDSEVLAYIYGPTDIFLNITLAFVLGMFISYVYKITHKGLSYSQSFMLTIVFVTLIVSMVMKTIPSHSC